MKQTGKPAKRDLHQDPLRTASQFALGVEPFLACAPVGSVSLASSALLTLHFARLLARFLSLHPRKSFTCAPVGSVSLASSALLTLHFARLLAALPFAAC